MMSPDEFQPLQLKGEIMDLEFTIDTDHRKRRRNRTTQSCLNCHTSKRKCDRKRPCQRCIQLGLTGLCVYEIDDPSLRDDPSLDESTRLRNRIAELESLVRELRGKPHPRWAESNFRDGDPNEKWHSRATKCVPLQKRSSQQQNGQPHSDGDPRNGPTTNGSRGHMLLSPIKTEPTTETPAHLYRFSPSPAPSMRYHTFQADVRSSDSHSSSSFDTDPRSGYNAPGTNPSANVYHSSASTNSHYSNDANGNSAATAPSCYPDGVSGGGTVGYSHPSSDDGHAYGDHYHRNGQCPCRTNPSLGIIYGTLSQSLGNSLGPLRQYVHHPPNTQCTLFRRVVDLRSALYVYDSPGLVASAYDSGPPSDNEIMTPLSASSGHASFTNGSPAVSPQEWNHLAAAGYNPYFPAPDLHGAYNVNHGMG